MKDVFSLIEQVVPHIGLELAQRLQIMQTLAASSERLGRKVLADRVQLSERSLRTIIESLRAQGIVEVTKAGIQLTHLGTSILDALDIEMTESNRYFELSQRVKQRLGLKYCYIVPGDADDNPQVGERLGRMVANILAEMLGTDRQVIAMTGGTTLAHVALQFSTELSQERDLIFVPARGGVGGSYDIQSNSIGALMAKQTDGVFVPLFIPENVDETTSKVLLNDPSIKYAVELSQEANCLLLSVGNANVMAERHDLSAEQKATLLLENAIGEAFGVFFDANGREVLRLPRVGIQLEELQQIPLLITVVGGKSKAAAVKAYYNLVPHHSILICDEGIATQVLSGAETPLK